MTAGRDIVVHPSAPMPKGYTFVSKGNVYVTAHCRSATYAAKKPLYVVSKRGAAKSTSTSTGGVLGLRCPIHVAKAVREDERASRSTRHEATARRDDALAAAFRDAVLAAYPHAPHDMVPQIVKHAMAKKQGRVARTSTLDMDRRVRLAVRAHIRHRHTDYDALLRGGSAIKQTHDEDQKENKKPRHKKSTPANGKSREAARASTLEQVDAIEREWAGGASKAVQKTAGKNDNGNGNGKTDGTKHTHPKSLEPKNSAQNTPTSARPTRLCKSAAASRIAQCLSSPRGRVSSDAIVIDSSDEADDFMIITSDSDEMDDVSNDSDDRIE